ncbi:hypothetical protein P8452_51478 [Trifolium repens]|nr:hypothetical protein P8452_51478 [Trifolium repens]
MVVVHPRAILKQSKFKDGELLAGLKFLNVERAFAEKHYDYSRLKFLIEDKEAMGWIMLFIFLKFHRNNQLAQCLLGADLHGAFILGE